MELLSFMFFSIILISVLYYFWLDNKTKAKHNQVDKVTRSTGLETELLDIHDLTNGRLDSNLIWMDELAKLSNIVYRKNGQVDINHEDWYKTPIKVIESQNEKALKGLYYEVWVHKSNDKIELAAIVFKGTENRNDWRTNLRWIRKRLFIHSYDYYDQLNETASDLMNLVHKQIGRENVEVVTAGHSLGGGLAQFMAYRIEKIKLVFAFNSSPVTGYYDVEKTKRKTNKKGCKIYRIYEGGEALDPIRKLLTLLYPAPLIKTENPSLIRIRTSFSVLKSRIKQHSMSDLANHLRKAKLGNLITE